MRKRLMISCTIEIQIAPNQAHGSFYHASSYAYIDFEKPDTSGTSACHLRYKKHAWFIYAYVVS